MTKSIDFFYDIVCPYAYLASLQIEDVARACNVAVRWKPVLLGGIYKSIQSAQHPSQTWNSAKQRWNAIDLKRQVDKCTTRFSLHPKHPQRTVEVMRLLSICPEEQRPNLSKRLYQAYWVDNVDFPNDTFLDKIAEEYNLSSEIYKTEQAKQVLRTNTDEAVQKGLFGVPSICFDEEMVWGQDRLHFVTSHFLHTQPVWPTAPSTSSPVVHFYHDFASPFSFLAAMIIEDFAEKTNATIEYVPILLGGLFRAIGTPIVPFATMSTQKQQYILKDVKRWAKWWKTPFHWPNQFPMRTILPLRVSLVVPEITKSIYQAYWINGEDISSAEVLAPLIEKLGHSPEEVFQKCSDEIIKKRLKDNTIEAENLGICGVPTFRVEKELWWGQDRLLDLAVHLNQT